MNNDKLVEKRASLEEAFKQTVSQLQEVENKKNELIANANAIKGAIAVIDDLLAEDTATKADKCPVVPINQ